jgi:hypothetical protein
MESPTYPAEGTQERKVLDALLEANGGTLYSDYFERQLYLSQFHRAKFNLEHKHHWKIERRPRNEYGFVGYRIVQEMKQLALV